MKSFGYDRICYSLITDHPSLNLSSGHGVFENYPDDWMTYYMDNGYDKIDPVPKYCFSSNRPFTWDFIINHLNISKNQKKLMNQASEANLLDGIAVPIHGVNGELSGVGMASSTGKPEIDRTRLMTIKAICHQFHLAYTDLLLADNKGNVNTRIKLTNREYEILSWAAEGKSDSDISDILGISYSTVRFHLNNVYSKLDANEKIFAITKAIRLGLILPSHIAEKPDELVR
jgi:DNA-binding CsgD family transcriptional regulator